MKKPVHPGTLIRKDCIDALGITITDAARALGVSPTTLSRLINGKSGISPEMAIRVSKRFGSTPEMWLRLQLAYDLAAVEKEMNRINLPSIKGFPVHRLFHPPPPTRQ